MKISIDTFIGESPRVTPRNLAPNAAQAAINARVQTGDIESWRQFLFTKALANGGTVATIYLLNDKWLSWNAQVDVARGLIPGDTSFLTFLTSPGLYATPRFTTYALATTGSEPFPVVTRPLGMPNPDTAPTLVIGSYETDTAFSVDITDACDDLSTNWLVSAGQHDGGGATSTVSQSASVGNPLPSFMLNAENNAGDPAWFVRDFGIANTTVAHIEVDVWIGTASGNAGALATVLFGVNKTGAGARIKFNGTFGSSQFIRIGRGEDFLSDGDLANAACTGVFTQSAWYTVKATKTVNTDNSSTIVAELWLAGTMRGTVTTTNFFENEGYCGGICGKGDDRLETFFDNFHLTASGSTSNNVVQAATAYVYTFVNDLGWESGPSPASATILRPDGVSVTVTTPTTADSSYGIVSKNIYRIVSGATGDIFLLVDTTPLAQAAYVDILDDAVISTPGTPLPSADWDLPNPLMEGIIPLPNNCMAGFFGNQLCFSAQGRPWAWPINYRLTTDTAIVAIANIDNTIVIGTKSFVYTATGNDPANYSMSKPGEPQACVAKRGMVYLDGVGVMFPSPDGYQVCAGSAGNVTNATSFLFTKRQWQALNPTSIRSAVHDGVLFFWFDGPTPDAGCAIDTNQNGFGKISLAFHATAVHVNPVTDSMYMVLDQVNEPSDGLLPIASSAVTPSGTTIYEFDADPANAMVYLWRGKLNLMPYETCFHFCKVEAGDYVNLVGRIYVDGVLLYTKLITGNTEFRIPESTATTSIELELVGTSSGRIFQIVQDVMELT